MAKQLASVGSTGSRLFRTLCRLGVEPILAHDCVEETRQMAASNTVAQIEALKADTAARVERQGRLLGEKIDRCAAVLNDKIDRCTAVLNDKIDRKTAALDERTAALCEKIDKNTAALWEKIDKNTAALNEKIEQNAAAHTDKIERLGERIEQLLLERSKEHAQAIASQKKLAWTLVVGALTAILGLTGALILQMREGTVIVQAPPAIEAAPSQDSTPPTIDDVEPLAPESEEP